MSITDKEKAKDYEPYTAEEELKMRQEKLIKTAKNITIMKKEEPKVITTTTTTVTTTTIGSPFPTNVAPEKMSKHKSTTLKIPATYKSRMDYMGNRLTLSQKDNIIDVKLKLKSEPGRGRNGRSIGFINMNTKTYHTERKRNSNQLFRKWNAYGICWQIIEDAHLIDQIRLKDEFGEYVIPTSYLMDKENAHFLHFKDEGFEKQIFMPVNRLEEFKRPHRF